MESGGEGNIEMLHTPCRNTHTHAHNTHAYEHACVHTYRHAPLEEGHVFSTPHQTGVHHDGLEAAPVQGPQLKGEEREVTTPTPPQ